MPVDPVRDAAIDVLLRVFDRAVHLDESLDKTIRRKAPADRGRRFLTYLCYGTVRHRSLSDHVLQDLCHQPLDKLPSPILTILRMAIFQSLFCTQVTKPAMVHTSVELAKARGHAGLARMVNAILRKAPESLDAIRFPDKTDAPLNYLRLRYSMPRWIIREWSEVYGVEQAEELCRISNEEAPLSLRMNALSGAIPAILKRVQASGLTVESISALPEALICHDGMATLLRSKAFQEGYVSPQDLASMLPAHLMEPKAGECVLDMCAAPGGKAAHMAALSHNETHIAALEPMRRRVYPLQDTVARLGARVVVLRGDGLQPPFVDGGFDGVLVDAPCSGLGTLRRHPDLKWNMHPEAIERLARQQEALLRSAIRLCKNGGRVVYSVCTFNRRETLDVIQAVLQDAPVGLEDGPELLNQWRVETGQYRTEPVASAWDGFFLTRLRKES